MKMQNYCVYYNVVGTNELEVNEKEERKIEQKSIEAPWYQRRLSMARTEGCSGE